MIRKHIYIDNEQNKQVKKVAKELGVAEAEIIRRSITFYMIKRKQYMESADGEI